MQIKIFSDDIVSFQIGTKALAFSAHWLEQTIAWDQQRPVIQR